MAKVNAFDILKVMSARNMDIRMSRAADNLVNVRKTRLGGQVILGVDSQTCQDVMSIGLGSNKFNACLLVINMEQYKIIEKELSGEVVDGRGSEETGGKQS